MDGWVDGWMDGWLVGWLFEDDKILPVENGMNGICVLLVNGMGGVSCLVFGDGMDD